MITTFKTLSRSEANEKMQEWIQGQGRILPDLETDYKQIRFDLEAIFNKAKLEMEDQKIDQYKFDVCYSILFYEYISGAKWFSMKMAADDGFWSYLAIVVAPHLLAMRWGYMNADHYWRKGTRNWFRTSWWYVYLAWDKNLQRTKMRLLDRRFTTDTIMHLVERTGRGTNIDLYRKFFDVYSKLTLQGIDVLKKNIKHSGGVFGAMMCLNTTYSVVMDPTFFKGGMEGYVRFLFSKMGADDSFYFDL